jgi:hypothetical protein
MPIVRNESEVEVTVRGEQIDFLKFEAARSKLHVLSHVYLLHCHWINRKQYLCTSSGTVGCKLCSNGEPKKTEYYYIGKIITQNKDKTLDEKEGLVRVPADVFFAMGTFEKDPDIGKPRRTIEWIVNKSGTGLDTEYSALSGKEIKVDEETIEENTTKLENAMENKELWLKKQTNETFGDNQEQTVNVEDIPF